MRDPFRYFKTSPEIIRLAVMMYVRFPLSLRQVEDLLHERGVDISHETVRAWWNRFGPRFAAEIRKRRIHHRSFSLWRWHLDEVFVRINGELHYGTGEMLGWLVERDIDPHIPVWDKGKRSDGTFSREDFTYDKGRNVYICPEGKALKTTGRLYEGKTFRYRASKFKGLSQIPSSNTA